MTSKWSFIDDKGEPLPIKSEVGLDLVDPQKQHRMLMEHFQVRYPGKLPINIEDSRERFRILEGIDAHLISDHFEEIKRDESINVLIGDIEFDADILGIKDMETGHISKFRTTRYVKSGDTIHVRLD